MQKSSIAAGADRIGWIPRLAHLSKLSALYAGRLAGIGQAEVGIASIEDSLG